MIGRRDQQASGWPVVKLLKQHGDKTLELADFRRIVAALGDRVQFVEKEHALDGLGVFDDMAQVSAGAAEVAAHYGGKIENHLGRRTDPVPEQGRARNPHRAQAKPRGVDAEASGEVRPVVRQHHCGRGEMLRRPSGLRAGEDGQARPEKTPHRGKFSATAEEEEEEGDAAVLVRPVRPVANNEAERNVRMITARKTSPDATGPTRARRIT